MAVFSLIVTRVKAAVLVGRNVAGAGACNGDAGGADGDGARCSRRQLPWTQTGTRPSATASGTAYSDVTSYRIKSIKNFQHNLFLEESYS